jgi:hypothetical protein
MLKCLPGLNISKYCDVIRSKDIIHRWMRWEDDHIWWRGKDFYSKFAAMYLRVREGNNTSYFSETRAVFTWLHAPQFANIC